MINASIRGAFLSMTCLAGAVWLIGRPAAFTAEQGPPVFITPEQAASDPDFAVQGEYVSEKAAVQVVALGKGAFHIVTYRGGLPGAGWDESPRQESDEDAAAVRSLIEDLKLVRVERKSPTLGAKPPTGTTVLFDGTKETLDKHWTPAARLGDDGLLMPGCTSSDTFTDFSLHIEFRLPFMPQARGQARGNSGLYLQGRYETQMLDSFGLEGKDNECGGLYTLKAPDLNLCLPPLSWQTYDFDFTAARWDKAGKKIANARVTLRHNGVVVHNDVELLKETPGGLSGEAPAPGPITLQDHGNPVRYRNVWVVTRSAEQEARRPIVPGFERFHASAGAEPAAGGRLLLGELNCTVCHAASEPLTANVLPRPAPFLDEIGKRVRPEYLLKLLGDPHREMPGTTMPDLLGDLPPAERNAAVLALVNFLAATDSPAEQQGDPQAAQRGRQLFHEIGCLACHAPRDGRPFPPRVSVPLGALERKYSTSSLAAFLLDPHKVRPSGRMPGFNLDAKQAVDVASYLAGSADVRPRNPNMTYAAYEGNWEKVPNFDEIKPVKTGQCAAFDLSVGGREGEFGVRFQGFLKIERDGDYTFHLGSDDGSLLFLDGKKAVDADGVHSHTVNSAAVPLKKGLHPLRVDYFQGGGEWTVALEYEGPGVPRQDASRAIVMTERGNPNPDPPPDATEPRFTFDPELAVRGKALFGSLGCANCHRGRSGAPQMAAAMAKPLSELDPAKGCLAASRDSAARAADPLDATPAAATSLRVPQYDLNLNQRVALAAALAAPAFTAIPTPEQSIAQAMTAFNCYACHARGKVGGPERDRNALFLTTIPEMGDEGRVPPPLDGVGDKLNDDWLKHVLQDGTDDRPYMLTAMPKFGAANVGHLAAAFVALDRRTEAKIPELNEPEIRAKGVGRQLVGDKALSCIKCHSFGPHKATGIQSLNLQSMSKRLREDWFFRYMVNPEAYRPGTRMPSGFINGQSTIRDVYDGDPARQILVIWTFLKDGERASIPEGLIANIIELKPEKQPIVYRNFIEGLSSRGIAVGYPEKGHIAWDADRLSLSLLWHGRFIDAGKHWEGRGNGAQGPLGDHVIRLEDTAPLAAFDPSTPWPTQPPRERGYKFRGYTLNAQGRPHFRYETPDFTVEDFPQPVARGNEGTFERHLSITARKPLENLYFRAATGQRIEPQPDGWHLVDGVLRVRVRNSAKSLLRESEGRKELIFPVPLSNGKAEIVQELVW